MAPTTWELRKVVQGKLTFHMTSVGLAGIYRVKVWGRTPKPFK